jgi:hydrogenase large subunit
MNKKINVKKLIEKIEGEATLGFHFEDEKIEFVDISFLTSRGIEEILKNRHALDALTITPRVCGICGHAHLQASVKALEDCFEGLKISNKARIIRELTLNFELIQNHFKWFYLTLLPLLGQKQKIFQATTPATLMAKAIAHLAGQYPHNSYAIVGGVVSDPTAIEILQVKNLIKETLSFFEKNIVVAQSEKLLECENIETLLEKEGDLPKLLHKLIEKNWQDLGKSFDRFIVFGENSYFQRGKSIATRVQPNIDEKFLHLFDNVDSLAKNVMYKDKYYEVGPLSRAMLLKTPLIKASHRRHGDSIFSRIIARTCEIVQLLHHSLSLLEKIDLSEVSCVYPEIELKKLTGFGTGAVEAARGSLIHKVELKEGIIKKYQIITPTQWNLSNGDRKTPGISQKAMIGLADERVAEFVFKSFDVCSVCTTH